jgi:hypothetical protein
MRIVPRPPAVRSRPEACVRRRGLPVRLALSGCLGLTLCLGALAARGVTSDSASGGPGVVTVGAPKTASSAPTLRKVAAPESASSGPGTA